MAGETISINSNEDAMKDMFLTFTICEMDYGIEIRYVTEIIGMQMITVVPDMPEYIKGIINLRGTVIPVINMRLRFNREEKDADDRTCIVVINVDDMNVGLIVDAVQEVMNISEGGVSVPSNLRSGTDTRYIKGIAETQDTIKLLIDADKLFLEKDYEAFESVV